MRVSPSRAWRRRVFLAAFAACAMLLAASLLHRFAAAQSGSSPFGRPPQQPRTATPAWPLPAAPPGQRTQAPPQQAAPAAPAAPVIARVGGRPITQADYDRIAQPYFRRLESQMGAGFDGELRRTAAFNVLDELIRRELLVLEAQRRKVEVTQAEIDALLRQDPFFQTNGRFDPAKFQDFKTNPASNYRMVLPLVQEMAAVAKLDESLRRRFTPTTAQVRAEWSRRSEQVRLRMLPLLTRDMPLEAESTAPDWEAYYQAHPEQFQRKTRVRLRYVRLPLPAEGDSARTAAEAAALARAHGIADSLRRGALPDTAALLTDSGLFEIPAPMIPGLGRVAGLIDTLGRLDSDSTIRVVGPYSSPAAVVVGVVTAREPRHVPPLREVLGDVKRRADAEQRRRADEAARRAYYEQHHDRWRGPRARVTRVTLDATTLRVKDPRPAEVDRWYARHGRSLSGIADSARVGLPPISDSLRAVARTRMLEEQRAVRAQEVMARIVRGLPDARDPRALVRGTGAGIETLSVVAGLRDSLFSPGFTDSLLAGAGAARGTVQGPRAFGSTWAAWRVDGRDSSYVPPYEVVRARSDQEYAEERRRKDEEEARAYFEQHRGDYRTPVRHALDLVTVRIPPADSVRVPDADLRRHYDANAAQYRQEEQIKARHILFTTRGADPDVDRAARARADSLLAAVRKEGGDFAELARRFSQEPGAATRGGDLGWFGRGRMVKEFETAAFALAPGQISDVVKTQFGYHIIRLEEHKPAGMRPFDEVRDEIRLQLAQARGDSSARRTATALRRRLAAGGDAVALAKPHGGVVAARAAANEPLPGIGVVTGLDQGLAGLAAGRWAPGVYRGGGGYVVARLRERLAPQPAEFEEVKARALEDMRNARRRALLDEKVAAIRTALQAGAPLDSLAAPHGGLKDSGLLGQFPGFLPGLGSEPRVLQKAFAMKPGELSDTLHVAAGVVWVRLEEKKSGDAAAFRAAASQIESELARQRYDEWLEARRKAVRIEILRPDLKGPRTPAPRT